MKNIYILLMVMASVTSCDKNQNTFKSEVRVNFFEGDTVLKQIISFNRDAQQHGIYISFYKNGKPRRMEFYEEGRLNGEAIYFYENGKIESKGTYLNGGKNGIFYGYYLSGCKRFEVPWHDNRITGVSIEYEDGTGIPICYSKHDSAGIKLKDKAKHR